MAESFDTQLKDAYLDGLYDSSWDHADDILSGPGLVDIFLARVYEKLGCPTPSDLRRRLLTLRKSGELPLASFPDRKTK